MVKTGFIKRRANDLHSSLIKGIATVEIPVSSLDRSVVWYEEVLSMIAVYRDERTAMLRFRGHGPGVPTVYLVETEERRPLYFVNSYTGITHSIIDLLAPNLQTFRHFLQEKGVEVGKMNTNEQGLGGFGFYDPDGNSLSACNISHWETAHNTSS